MHRIASIEKALVHLTQEDHARCLLSAAADAASPSQAKRNGKSR
jgi:hypothetical protein